MKTLKDCKVGDRVFLWCRGWRDWDNEIVTVLKKGMLTDVKYCVGKTRTFTEDTPVKFV